MTLTDEQATLVARSIPDDAFRIDQGEQWMARFKGQPIYAKNEVYYSSESRLKTALRANYEILWHAREMFDQPESKNPWYTFANSGNRRKVLDKLIELGIITIERVR